MIIEGQAVYLLTIIVIVVGILIFIFNLSKVIPLFEYMKANHSDFLKKKIFHYRHHSFYL